MSWGDPSWIWGAAMAFLLTVAGFSVVGHRRRVLISRAGHAHQIIRMADSISPVRRFVKQTMVAVAILLLGVSLARPMLRDQVSWKQRGFDVALVVDVSRSMLARDIYPTRLDRAKLEGTSLMDKFAGDRVAVIGVAGGVLASPLTTDTEAAKLLLSGLEPGVFPAGSDLGAGVRAARCLLRPDVTWDPDCTESRDGGRLGAPSGTSTPEDRGRAIILLTDGEDQGSTVAREVARARDLGIEVLVVGLGTRAGERVPPAPQAAGGMRPRAESQEFRMTRLNEGLLLTLAGGDAGDRGARPEGRYFPAEPRRPGLPGLDEALGRLRRGDDEARLDSKPKEVYLWFLVPAFALLALEPLLSERRRASRVAVGTRDTDRESGAADAADAVAQEDVHA